MRPRSSSLLLASAVALLAAFPGSAAAAEWRCEGSALSGTVLGAALPSVKANAGALGCRTQSAGGAVKLPLPVEVSALSATTALAGPAGSVSDQHAAAAGGVLDLTVKALPSLPVQLPEIPIPSDLGAVNVDLSAISDPLGLIPSALTLDLRPALDTLLPDRQLPTADLLRVQAAMAYASGRCVGGVPKLEGASRVAGITVLGQELGTDRLVQQTVTLLDTQNIDLSNVDLSAVTGLPGGILELPVLGPQVSAAIQGALDALPPIQIPPTLAHVKVEPGGQTTENGLLVQRALRAQVSIAGQQIADVTLGQAAAGVDGVTCGKAAVALACTDKRLVLIDVFRKDDRVQLLGAADPALAGRMVDIVFERTGKVVAEAKVRRDGSFSTTADLPAAGVRDTNLARYKAVLGKERSLNLKLARRMIVTKMVSRRGKVTIVGRVVRPLAEQVEAITIKRRVSCSKSEVVGSVMPRKDGSFRATVPAPEGVSAAVYRLSTRVRHNVSNPKTFPTYTLPRAVNLLD